MLFRLLTSLVVVLLAAPALAQSAPAPDATSASSDEIARGLFQAGKAAFDAGTYDEALDFFEQAYARSHRPQLQYNIGLAADRLRRDDKALASFKAYLAEVPDAENRAEVEARVRALERALAEREASAPLSAATPMPPTPQQTAREAPAEPHTRAPRAATQPTEAPQARPLVKQWWFWAGIGTVVAGGVITAVALASGGDKHAAPFASRTGVTVMALGAR